MAQGANPHQVALALARELRSPPPTLLVLEDLHWADEATLDVFTLLVRRAETVPALVVGTYRDDALENAHPLRRVLGELATTTAVRRLKLAPLSPDAVRQLAAPHGVDGRELYDKTGGNPFFVVEVLAGGSEEIPATVKDAVLARAMRLSPNARALLEAAAVVPQRAELWLLEALAGAAVGAVDECVSAGMLVAEGDGVVFRHELARLSLESSVGPASKARLAPSGSGRHLWSPGATLRTSPAWPTTPRRPGTPTPSSASPSPPRSEPARWAPTARPPPSTGASSGPGPRLPLDAARRRAGATFTRVLPDRPER